MNRRDIIRHELLHVLAGAPFLADRLDAKGYARVEAVITVGAHGGEAAMIGLDDALMHQEASIGAAGPLLDAKDGAAILTGGTRAQLLAAGLSDVDADLLKRWGGSEDDRLRYFAAGRRLVAATKLNRVVSLLLADDHLDPIPLELLAPRPRVLHALRQVDIARAQRLRDPKRNPSYAR